MTLPETFSTAVPVLETSRLRLRGFRADDFAPWLAMSQLPAFHRYLTPEPMPAEEVWKLLLRSAGHWVVLGYGFWAVEEKATGRFVGGTGFLNLHRAIEPPLGDPLCVRHALGAGCAGLDGAGRAGAADLLREGGQAVRADHVQHSPPQT